MDAILTKVTQQAMNYAIRSGMAITGTYALKQLSRLMQTVEKDSRSNLARLQLRLESKVRIISPAIDMIELIAARGNTSLESAVALTKSIRCDIQALGRQLALAASQTGQTPAENEASVGRIKLEIEELLARIEDAVPLINLAITTSGARLSTSLPATVSPSRLLQASTFLTAGDSQYAAYPGVPVQVGPVFTLTMFMLFGAHAHRPHDEDNTREMTWKEVMHKARVKLVRVPLDRLSDVQVEPSARLRGDNLASEFGYRLVVVEDLDDDRVHDFSDQKDKPAPFEGVDSAGVREMIPIHQISKIFYADTGKILNIGSDGSVNQPVLLLKRDVNAVPPRQLATQVSAEDGWSNPPSGSEAGSDNDDFDAEAQLLREAAHSDTEVNEQQNKRWTLPADLDPEWIAFEVFTDDTPDESEDEHESEDDVSSEGGGSELSQSNPSSPARSTGLEPAIERLSLEHPEEQADRSLIRQTGQVQTAAALPALKTSLSLLELLMRLTSLQQFTQSSHLVSADELLNFFLSESSTVGAGSDSALRQRVRRSARQKVGFDPYDESPVKFRSEDDIQQTGDPTRMTSPRSSPTDRSGRHASRLSSQYVRSPLGRSPRLSTGASRRVIAPVTFEPPVTPEKAKREEKAGLVTP